MVRIFLCILGLFLAIPILALVVLTFRLSITLSGIGYLFGTLLVCSGLILAPWINRFYSPIAAGITIILLIAGIRLFLFDQTNTNIKLVKLPDGKGTSWINTIIDEQDTLLFGETFFHWIGGNSDSEHTGLAPAFKNIYAEMRKEGNFSTPVVNTYLNLQKPNRFDAVIIEPETQPQFGVVFLHGYMGNVTAQCWVIARAVKEAGGVTVCPSTIWTGEWWKPNGQQILQNTFNYLKERGIHSIYLSGFSNGGFSMGRLASQLADEKDLRGLIFVDGFVNGVSVRELGLPILIIEGTQDERVPLYVALQFAQDVGNLGTYVAIDSDHFLIMKEPELVQVEIAKWLESKVAGQ